jgi:hypothetical protein
MDQVKTDSSVNCNINEKNDCAICFFGIIKILERYPISIADII